MWCLGRDGCYEEWIPLLRHIGPIEFNSITVQVGDSSCDRFQFYYDLIHHFISAINVSRSFALISAFNINNIPRNTKLMFYYIYIYN